MNKRGFTYLELIISVVVLSIAMIVISSSIFYITQRSAKNENSYKSSMLIESLAAQLEAGLWTLKTYEAVTEHFKTNSLKDWIDEDFYEDFDYELQLFDKEKTLAQYTSEGLLSGGGVAVAENNIGFHFSSNDTELNAFLTRLADPLPRNTYRFDCASPSLQVLAAKDIALEVVHFELIQDQMVAPQAYLVVEEVPFVGDCIFLTINIDTKTLTDLSPEEVVARARKLLKIVNKSNKKLIVSFSPIYKDRLIYFSVDLYTKSGIAVNSLTKAVLVQ